MTTATALKPSVPKQPPSPNTTGRVIAAAKSAYQYPLIIKHLWHAPLLQARDQEIVYRDLRRFTYRELRELRERVGRLASALAGVGVRPGDTVGVLDWDSNGFLEAFFAVPMMGAVLQTVNVRLSRVLVARPTRLRAGQMKLATSRSSPDCATRSPPSPDSPNAGRHSRDGACGEHSTHGMERISPLSVSKNLARFAGLSLASAGAWD